MMHWEDVATVKLITASCERTTSKFYGNLNLTSSKVFPLNTSEYLCSLKFLSQSETLMAWLRGLNVQLIFPGQDRCGNDGEPAGDVTGEPLGDGEGDGYDATGDDGMVRWSDVRDDGTVECKPLVVNICNMLFGSAVENWGLKGREAWHFDNRAPKQKDSETNNQKISVY